MVTLAGDSFRQFRGGFAYVACVDENLNAVWPNSILTKSILLFLISGANYEGPRALSFT